jgi:hypothetical protein
MNNNKGFIMRIVLLIGAIIALKYFFHFDLFEWFKSPKAQEIIQPTITFLKSVYALLNDFVRSIVS